MQWSKITTKQVTGNKESITDYLLHDVAGADILQKRCSYLDMHNSVSIGMHAWRNITTKKCNNRI